MSGLARGASLIVLLAASAWGQSATENLLKARGLVAKNKFAPALKLVQKANAEAGNDLETHLELLELAGVCHASMKKPALAKTEFQKLLSLFPSWNLKSKLTPFVTKAWAEAKKTTEPLSIFPAAPETGTGAISEVAIDVRADPLKLAKTVIFNFRTGVGKWKIRAVPVVPGRVVARVDPGTKVEWYATVIGESDAEVMRIRNLDSPITHTWSAPVKSAEPPPKVEEPPPPKVEDRPKADEPPKVADAPRREDAPKIVPEPREPEPDLRERPTGKAGWVTPVSISLLGLGAAAGGAGAYFAITSGGARSEFAAGTANPGVVVGLTRTRAQALDSQAQTNALLANTAWGVGGGLILAGVALWIFGPEASP
jgi:hypothetical protein